MKHSHTKLVWRRHAKSCVLVLGCASWVSEEAWNGSLILHLGAPGNSQCNHTVDKGWLALQCGLDSQ